MRRSSRLPRVVSLALLAAVAIAAIVSQPHAVRAQSGYSNDTLYILPFWAPFAGSSDKAAAAEAADLRRRLGPEGPHVRFGFSGYVFVSMESWNVDPSNPAAIRAALASTIRTIDAYVDKARAARVPVALAILTAIRERYDPVQRASEQEDTRSMQWYADNSLAPGWWTHSRYARRARRVQEAYVREIGKVIANRMRRYPDTLVAAAGDGEVELAFNSAKRPAGSAPVFADYSPFTVAEFRDWLRLGGLYAPGQPFAGQGYASGARYAGDASPGEDTNRDGHTLNGDLGTSFRTWALLHFDWSLNDPGTGKDPRAVTLATHASPGFKRLPAGGAGGFDAPRTPRPNKSDPWWNTWVLFKQTMLQHHNTDFARWITTSADPDTGATVPRERWYSYQIPSDYAFSGSPDNPTERFASSMSAWWTGDVSPFGSVGITAFNLDWSNWKPPSPSTYTLRNVAPRIAERGLRWGIIEWNPGLLPFDTGVTTKLEIYREEMALIERYRPSLLQPFAWGDKINKVQDSGFEVGLRELVARINDLSPPRLSVARASLRFGAVQSGVRTPGQHVQMDQTGWVRRAWQATSDQPWLIVEPASGRGPGRLTVKVDPARAPLPAGAATGRIKVVSADVAAPVSIVVTLNVAAPRATAAPFGQVDTPAQGAAGLTSIVPVTGWALDDIGVERVTVYRQCVPADRQGLCQAIDGRNVVFVGRAEIQEGVRPDVEGAFATQPLAYRAGWGYLLSTVDLPDLPASLPRGGRGNIELHILATDTEGRTTWLGRSQADHAATKIGVANPKRP